MVITRPTSTNFHPAGLISTLDILPKELCAAISMNGEETEYRDAYEKCVEYEIVAWLKSPGRRVLETSLRKLLLRSWAATQCQDELLAVQDAVWSDFPNSFKLASFPQVLSDNTTGQLVNLMFCLVTLSWFVGKGCELASHGHSSC